MASMWYTKGLKACLDGTIELTTDTIKVMLVEDSYTADKDHEFVTFSGPECPSNHEISVTNYTGGYGGSGRKTATVTLQANTTDDRVEVVIGDLTWSNLGVGATIGGAVLLKETTNDNASRIIGFIDVDDVATNTGNVTLDFSTSGNLRINVV